MDCCPHRKHRVPRVCFQLVFWTSAPSSLWKQCFKNLQAGLWDRWSLYLLCKSASYWQTKLEEKYHRIVRNFFKNENERNYWVILFLKCELRWQLKRSCFPVVRLRRWIKTNLIPKTFLDFKDWWHYLSSYNCWRKYMPFLTTDVFLSLSEMAVERISCLPGWHRTR